MCPRCGHVQNQMCPRCGRVQNQMCPRCGRVQIKCTQGTDMCKIKCAQGAVVYSMCCAVWWEGTALLLILTELKMCLPLDYSLTESVDQWRSGGNQSIWRKALARGSATCYVLQPNTWNKIQTCSQGHNSSVRSVEGLLFCVMQRLGFESPLSLQ